MTKKIKLATFVLVSVAVFAYTCFGSDMSEGERREKIIHYWDINVPGEINYYEERSFQGTSICVHFIVSGDYIKYLRDQYVFVETFSGAEERFHKNPEKTKEIISEIDPLKRVGCFQKLPDVYKKYSGPKNVFSIRIKGPNGPVSAMVDVKSGYLWLWLVKM